MAICRSALGVRAFIWPTIFAPQRRPKITPRFFVLDLAGGDAATWLCGRWVWFVRRFTRKWHCDQHMQWRAAQRYHFSLHRWFWIGRQLIWRSRWWKGIQWMARHFSASKWLCQTHNVACTAHTSASGAKGVSAKWRQHFAWGASSQWEKSPQVHRAVPKIEENAFEVGIWHCGWRRGSGSGCGRWGPASCWLWGKTYKRMAGESSLRFWLACINGSGKMETSKWKWRRPLVQARTLQDFVA